MILKLNLRSSIKIITSILIFTLSLESKSQITLTPNAASINANPKNNEMIIQGKGLVIQKKYTLTSTEPSSNIVNMSCTGIPPALNAMAGIIKDSGGDNPYNSGVVYDCEQTVGTTSIVGLNLITITELDLGLGDTLIIEDFYDTYKFTGNSIPKPFIAAANTFSQSVPPNLFFSFKVKFKTNGDANAGQGFSLSFQAVNNQPAEELETPLGGNSLVFSTNTGAFNAGFLSLLEPKGINSVGLGYLPKNTGAVSTSIGFKNVSSGNNSIAIGTSNRSSSTYAVSIGNSNVSSNSSSVAIGGGNESRGANSIAIGVGLISKGAWNVALGAYNDIVENPNTLQPNPTDRIFQVGNGLSRLNRSNALTITQNGNMGIGPNVLATHPDSRLVVDGFTKLGIDAPKIQTKLITETMPPADGSKSIPHGLTDSKILQVAIYANVNSQYVPPNYTGNDNLEYNYYYTSGNVIVFNKLGKSSALNNVPVKIFITYTE